MSQRHIIHQRIPSCSGTTRKNSKQLIDDILAHLPKSIREQHYNMTIGQRRPQEDINITAVTQELRFPAGNYITIVDFHSGYYGLVERIDRYYNELFQPSIHKKWTKLYFFSFLFLNLWCGGLHGKNMWGKRHSREVTEGNQVFPLYTIERFPNLSAHCVTRLLKKIDNKH